MEMLIVILKGNSIVFLLPGWTYPWHKSTLRYTHILIPSLSLSLLSNLLHPAPVSCCTCHQGCRFSSLGLLTAPFTLLSIFHFNSQLCFLTSCSPFPQLCPAYLNSPVLITSNIFPPFSLSFSFGSHDNHPIFGVYFNISNVNLTSMF